jgi:uncharacterized protein
MYEYVIYQCVTGSQAYGLSHSGSDVDRRGFYLPPADLHWSLAGVPEQLESDDERVYWEVGKFIRLALKANPNIIETLYSPMVERCTPAAKPLIDNRHIFLSKRIHQTYNSYAASQFKKLEQDMRARGEVKWKHAMHLIRLQLAGSAILRTGNVILDTGPWRDKLLAIRSGSVPWQEVDAWRIQLHRELDDALAGTSLPEEPDYKRANELLIEARRYAARPEYAR